MLLIMRVETSFYIKGEIQGLSIDIKTAVAKCVRKISTEKNPCTICSSSNSPGRHLSRLVANKSNQTQSKKMCTPPTEIIKAISPASHSQLQPSQRKL
jgi:hypothetical protein